MSADDQNDKATDDECPTSLPLEARNFSRALSKKRSSKAIKTPQYNAQNSSLPNTIYDQQNINPSPKNRSGANLQQTQKQNTHPTDTVKQTTPAIMHPNFNANHQPPDPARSLNDIPAPAPRRMDVMRQLYGVAIAYNYPHSHNDSYPHKGETHFDTSKLACDIRQDKVDLKNNKIASNNAASNDNFNDNENHKKTKLCSPWQLIESPALSSYIELLELAGLIKLPASFYRHPHADQAKELLRPLYPLSEKAAALDMVDISSVITQYPLLTRYGIGQQRPRDCYQQLLKPNKSQQQVVKSNPPPLNNVQTQSERLAMVMPEMLNDGFAPDWEVILYPERFDNEVDSLATDILACRLAVHILGQCETRQTINRRLSAQQICQYMRSYLLSQCHFARRDAEEYRHIRLYAGHVIVAAVYLGWQVQISADNKVYFAVSSRSALFTRYPNLSEYYINGWH